MNKLNVLDNRGYVVIHDVMGSDLTVANAARVSYSKKSEALSEGDKRLIDFLAREGHCYDDQTEVLTDKGFKKWVDITKNDKLAAFEPKTGKLKDYEVPLDLTKEYVNEDLLVFETPDVSLKVTKGHSLYASITNSDKKRKNPKFELIVADKIIKTKNGVAEKEFYKKPMRMKKCSFGSCLTSKEEIALFKLYGFFVGDGYASTKNSINFHLKKERKIEYLRDISNKSGFKLKENKNDVFVITDEGLGEKFRNLFYNEKGEKTFPSSFFYESENNILAFIDGLLNSDGSKKRNTYVYDTTSEELANKLQAIATANGVAMSLNSNGYINRLNINSRRNTPRINDTLQNSYSLEHYKGFVYCATVSTGLLLVRRNNKTLLCGNTSPFRHVMAQFEFNAPLMVARQHWKYVVGSSMLEATGDNMDAWNESSRRYVTEEPSFYVPKPNEWRSAPLNSKQGSGGIVFKEIGDEAFVRLIDQIENNLENYKWALDSGICAEQARLFLPAYGMYVKYYWTASIQSVCHFLNQRLAHDSQVEIQEYAKAVLELIKPMFPISVEKLVK